MKKTHCDHCGEEIDPEELGIPTCCSSQVLEQMETLRDALKNMLGTFDSPLMRLKVDTEWTRTVIESARKAMGMDTPCG